MKENNNAMINLSPLEQQRIILKQRLVRFFVIFNLGLIFTFSIGFILLFPSLFYLIYQERELNRNLEILKKEPILTEFRDIENNIKSVNQKLTIIQNNQKSLISPSILLKKILAGKPEGLSFQSIAYSFLNGKSVFSLSGKTSTRSVFLRFIEDLKKEKMIKNIQSPLANILKEKDSGFNLTLEF